MATTVGWTLGRFLLPNLATVTIGIGLGIFQYLILQHRIRNAWRWIPATAIGWALGSLITLVGVPERFDIFVGFIIGLSTGAAQWIVLNNEIYWSGWWFVLSIVAWVTGIALLPGLILTGILAGAITGIALILLPKKERLRGE